jgi:hypothetical protein
MWEFGKRIKWFDNEEVAVINSQQLDNIVNLFKEEVSAEGFVEGSNFMKPDNFDAEINRVSDQL